MLFYTDGYRWPHWKENTEAEIRRGQRVHTLNVHRDEALRVGCQGSRNVPKRSGSQRIRNVEASEKEVYPRQLGTVYSLGGRACEAFGFYALKYRKPLKAPKQKQYKLSYI